MPPAAPWPPAAWDCFGKHGVQMVDELTASTCLGVTLLMCLCLSSCPSFEWNFLGYRKPNVTKHVTKGRGGWGTGGHGAAGWGWTW